MNLEQKYPDYEIVHFISMYDDVISIEGHALNATIFHDREYITTILKEIDQLKDEEDLIVEFMNQCAWTNEKEKSVSRIKRELELVLHLAT